MGRFKQIISAVLAVGMLTFSTPLGVFAEDTTPTIPTGTPDIASGNAYGINLLAESGDGWTLDDDGTLTIENDAGMHDWADYGRDNTMDTDMIKSVIIKDGVTLIADRAFVNCFSLSSVTIPDSVTKIGNVAFAVCSSLTSIDIPDSVTSIGYDAFIYCTGLTSVAIPSKVTSIGSDAFRDNNSCTFYMSTKAPEIGDGAVFGTNPTIYVPFGGTGYDQGNWTNYVANIIKPESLDIAGGSIKITSTGYSVNGGAETPYTGDYVITGTTNANTITVESGEHNITIKDVNINSMFAPFDIMQGATVNLTLVGTNVLLTSPNGAYAALHVPVGAKLTITESAGSLTANGGAYGAGIGGANYENCGNVTIDGGTVTATSDTGAGIGGGMSDAGTDGAGGEITINGGTVTATSDYGAGIGGGVGGVGGIIKITGGTVTATANDGAGIGGGDGSMFGSGSGGDITISGTAVVTATGSYGAGIGGGNKGDGGIIKVIGGTVEATSIGPSAGIGGGAGGAGGTITIAGGNVNATSNFYGAGIGGGASGSGGTIEITGGTVEATSKGISGAGIGGGQNGSGGTITISGGVVTAKGSTQGAGIGSGRNGIDGSVTISGGTVMAIGGAGAGIGNGDGGSGVTFTANGNAVIFASSMMSAPISDTSGKDNGAWTGVIFEGADGKVYGDNIKPTEDFTIPVGYTLEIPRCLMLDISDITVTNEGTVNTHCKDTNEYEGGTVNRPHGTLEHTAKAEATCTADGNEEYWKCPDCNKMFSDDTATTEFDPTIGKLGHDMGGWEQNDSNTHIKKCQRDGCTYSETEAHGYGEWITVTPATEDSEGLKKHICTACGYEETAVIPKLEKPTPPSGGGSTGGTTSPQPFDKDNTSTRGWDEISKEIENAKSGDVININMNGTKIVQSYIFDKLAGKDVTVTFDMGKGLVWIVNGKDVPTGKHSYIDFGVKVNTNNIPADLIGNEKAIQISLSHDGNLGFTATLAIDLGKENADKFANLYYYDKSGKKLDFISQSKIDKDGKALLKFTHASDYAIIIRENEDITLGAGYEEVPAEPIKFD